MTDKYGILTEIEFDRINYCDIENL